MGEFLFCNKTFLLLCVVMCKLYLLITYLCFGFVLSSSVTINASVEKSESMFPYESRKNKLVELSNLVYNNNSDEIIPLDLLDKKIDGVISDLRKLALNNDSVIQSIELTRYFFNGLVLNKYRDDYFFVAGEKIYHRKVKNRVGSIICKDIREYMFYKICNFTAKQNWPINAIVEKDLESILFSDKTRFSSSINALITEYLHLDFMKVTHKTSEYINHFFDGKFIMHELKYEDPGCLII